jgi:hypothetical protein
VNVPDSLGGLRSFAIQFSSLEKLVEIVDNPLAALDIAITREHWSKLCSRELAYRGVDQFKEV